MANPPIHKIRFGGCEVAIWQGLHGMSVTVKHSYFDKEAKTYKDTPFIQDRQIPSTTELLQMAFAWIVANKKSEDKTHGPDQVAKGLRDDALPPIGDEHGREVPF